MRGRPPLPEWERKTEIMRLRTTKAKADFLWQQALKRGLSLSKYLELRLFGGTESINPGK